MNQTSPATLRQLRQFGLMVGSILMVIGLWRFYKGDFETGRVVFWTVGGLLFGAGLLLPAALRPVYAVWMKLAYGLAYVNTRVLITLIFFLVVTPIGLLMRLIKGDLLAEKFDKTARTYWHEMEPLPSVKEHCERQF
jgi:hypothetical protein